MTLAPLPRAFFDRNALGLAPALVGCLLVRSAGRGRVRVARIVETEAYVGEHDLACHARAGRTPRTEVMYGPPGHAYVYFVYGMHHMLNVVGGPDGDPNAVLIRAATEVAPGLLAPETRSLPLLHPATGPGNLCTALEVTLSLNRGDLCSADAPLFIAPRLPGPAPRLWAGPRVGVGYAGRWVQEKLRFCDLDSSAVSRPRPPRGARALRRRE